jgi:hypothetical protein
MKRQATRDIARAIEKFPRSDKPLWLSRASRESLLISRDNHKGLSLREGKTAIIK